MIKHIVLWRLKDHALGASKQDNAEKLKALLEALRDTVKEIKHLEVGINAQAAVAPGILPPATLAHPCAAVAPGVVDPSPRSPAPCMDAQVSPEAGCRERPTLAHPCAADVALYSEFSSWDDLDAYQKHPEHLKVAGFVQEVRLERHVVDYEI